MADLGARYIDWMYSLISNQSRDITNYSQILNNLYNTEFIWIIALDANRADDGVELRYRFGFEAGIDSDTIATYFNSRPCSILEMMVALSLRCEDDIMQGTEERRVDRWFWVMMDNSGLSELTNNKYSDFLAIDITGRLLNREYSPEGIGGWVTVPNCKYDLRNVDIWYQINWYLTSILRK